MGVNDQKLRELADDYERVTGKRFEHFFCPILFRDEPTELCNGHIVNKAFDASKLTTLQRKDVDGWYGTNFESDFADLRYRRMKVRDIAKDQTAAKRLGLRVITNGKPIPHYYPKGRVPAQHSTIALDGIRLALKMPPHELAKICDELQLECSKNLMLPSIVSLLKAAHLTLFAMLGYSYVFMEAGRLFGKILGDFYLANKDRSRAEILERARPYFGPYSQLVRPIGSGLDDFAGSPDARGFRVCERDGVRWGLIVFIRLSPQDIHSVMAPGFDSAQGAALFRDFLKGGGQQILARHVVFDGNAWQASPETVTLTWPEDSLSSN